MPGAFSGLTTIVKIMLMYYIDACTSSKLRKNWEMAVEEAINNLPAAE